MQWHVEGVALVLVLALLGLMWRHVRRGRWPWRPERRLTYAAAVEMLMKWPKQPLRTDEEISQVSEQRRKIFRALFPYTSKGPGDYKPRIIHIAGTKGKGSVAELLRQSLLAASGSAPRETPVVGTFCSPHIHEVTERIGVDGNSISEADLVRLTPLAVGCFRDLDWGIPFDKLLALALFYFAETRPRFILLEVGIGGLHDSTNFVETCDAAVITRIGYDHMDLLGNTLSAIAFQKAGIMKKDAVVFTLGEQNKDVSQVLRKQAEVVGVKDFVEVPSLRDLPRIVDNVTSRSAAGSTSPHLKAYRQKHWAAALEAATDPMCWAHPENVLLAASVIDYLGFPLGATFPAVVKAFPCRFETIEATDSLTVIIDGAHNHVSCRSLRERIQECHADPSEQRVLFFGCARDKNAEAMLTELLRPGKDGEPYFHGVALTRTPHMRASFTAAELHSLLPADALAAAQTRQLQVALGDDHCAQEGIHADLVNLYQAVVKQAQGRAAGTAELVDGLAVDDGQAQAVSVEQQPKVVIVICGSFYLAAALRKYILAAKR